MNYSELRLLLALMGNARIPHMEAEIFADVAATTLYLHNLCREDWYHSGESNAYLVFVYARDVLDDRWQAAESVLAHDQDLWNRYIDRICGSLR